MDRDELFVYEVSWWEALAPFAPVYALFLLLALLAEHHRK